MQKNKIKINSSVIPSQIEFSSVFNVAEIFIDRHIKEGRKDKVAIFTTDGIEVTYGELFENVNKSGNLLKRLGLRKGDRILMMVKDSPEFFYLFWGAIKAGIIPVPINTLLRTKDYAFIIQDSACSAVVYSPEYSEEVEPAIGKIYQKLVFSLVTTGKLKCFMEQMLIENSELEVSTAIS